MQTYRHSGAMSLPGIPITIAAGLLTAGVLGFVYSYAVVYIPLIYINVLLTFGFGFAIGAAVAWGANVGKIRNNFMAGAYGLAFGCAGLYVAWAADLLARAGVPFCIEVFYPSVLWDYMQFFYENGFWAVGHGGGGNVNGVFLGAVWAIEAAIIVVTATWVAHSAIASRPFCEPCNRWTTAEEGVSRLSLHGAEENALNRLLAGELAALGQMNRATANEASYLRLDLATCSRCADSNFLTIQLVQHTVNKKGEPQVETKPLLTNLIVDAANVPLVREAGREPKPDLPEEFAEPPSATEADASQADGETPPFLEFLDDREEEKRPGK